MQQRWTVRVVWIGLMVLLVGCGGELSGGVKPTLELSPCQLSAPGLAVRMAARCGRLTVFEDRAAQSGREITLNVAVLPATGRNVASDPLFFLTGGPGQAATESYLSVAPAFGGIRQLRDIVLVDQRGTGNSHALRCPPPESSSEAEPPSAEESAAYLTDCLARLDADPRLYTTALAMADLDEVRAALGYETINLYGLSYGTRAALTYLRFYPDRVRTMILDGVVPPDLPLGRDVGHDAQRALDLIWARCAAEPDCAAASPDIQGTWAALFASLATQPVTVALEHPITGEATTVELTQEALAVTVRLLSYSAETAALLPLLVHEAHETGQWDKLAAQYLMVTDDLARSISEGMNISVLCTEDFPFFTSEEAEAQNAGSYLGNLQSDQLESICATWPRGALPADFRAPLRSEVPVLLLSGEADPVTPPAYGEQVAAGLPNSLHLVAAGHGHNVIYRGCLPQLATTFVEEASVQALDTACVARITPLSFFLDFSGPRP